MQVIEPAVRCFAVVNTDEGEPKRTPSKRAQKAVDDSVYMVFDTETTADAAQALTFGFAGIYINDRLDRMILFYNPATVSEKDLTILSEFAGNFAKDVNGSEGKPCVIMTKHDFVHKHFYPVLRTHKHPLVGFNLPFDISRLAIEATESKDKTYENGFSFLLSENTNNPRVLVKHRNSTSSFIKFSTSFANKRWGGHSFNGSFIDLRTVGKAITDKQYSLGSACEDFNVKIQKMKTTEHGKITPDYVRYAVTDVIATQQLFVAMKERCRLYLIEGDYEKLYSPASIGKQYLKRMGVKPFMEKNPQFDKELLGKIMSSFYGGWAELLHRCKPIKVSYLDFLSQYPTLITLLNLDQFVKASSVRVEDATTEAQTLLDTLTLADLLKPATWATLHYLCEIVPNGDILPIRARYAKTTDGLSENAFNIGVHKVTSDGQALCYAFPDLLASKMLTGKAPKITKAYKFIASEPQVDLKDIQVLPKITVSKEQSFVKTLIEQRQVIKQEMKVLKKAGQEKTPAYNVLEIKQNILKIIANSCGYGIYAEVNSNDADNEIEAQVFSIDSPFASTVNRTEKVGNAFNPVLASLITSGGKLLQAMAQKVVEDAGGYVAYRDTDSLFVSPPHVKIVQDAMQTLNPYSYGEGVKPEPVLKVEDSKLTGKDLHDVWFYGISSKRYVLYDIKPDNKGYTIHKFSSHGLGSIVLDTKDKITDAQVEEYSLLKKMTKKEFAAITWWVNILKTHYEADFVENTYYKKHAVVQFGVSSWILFKRFAEFNEGKTYDQQIKPFNFASVGIAVQTDPETKEPIVPYVPYTPNPDEAHEQPFVDVKSGKVYISDTSKYWKTLDLVFSQYCIHPEAKMSGSVGWLSRRDLLVEKGGVIVVGKEINQLDTTQALGVDKNTTLIYHNCPVKILALTPASIDGKLSRSQMFRLKAKVRNGQEVNITDKVAGVIF